MKAVAVLLAWAAVACATSAKAPASNRPGASAPSAARPSAIGPAATVAEPAEAGAPSPVVEAPPPAAMLDATFRSELSEPVWVFALERPPHAAAYGAGKLFLHDAKGWRSETVPSVVSDGPRPELAIFYGRDYRVRVVGTRYSESGASAFYMRWLPSGLTPERAEIGRLGTPKGALVAVLGTADPEIVCRPGEVCLVKSVKGWQTIAAVDDLELVTVGAGVGWAVASKRLLRLEKSGFTPLGPVGSWARADALFSTGVGAWVVETWPSRLHYFDGTAWQVIPSPVVRPRAMYGARPDALWLAGDSGLAHFDGHSWRLVRDAPAPLSSVSGRGADEVWVGGKRGLFRVELARDAARPSEQPPGDAGARPATP